MSLQRVRRMSLPTIATIVVRETALARATVIENVEPK
jgi:hypothetical protein